MSVGTQIALGMLLLVSGASGYERYMLQGDNWRALIDVAVAIGGMMVLGAGIDRFKL